MHTIHLFLYSLTTCSLNSNHFTIMYSAGHVFYFLVGVCVLLEL